MEEMVCINDCSKYFFYLSKKFVIFLEFSFRHEVTFEDMIQELAAISFVITNFKFTINSFFFWNLKVV